MSKINRRVFLGGAAALALAGAAGWAWQSGLFSAPTASEVEGAAGPAASGDLSGMNEAPGIGERSLGPADAKVVMVEYASATCPHCADFHRDTWPTIKKEYVDTGKVRYVFREFPFDDLALAAFMVARCAPAEQYFPIIDILFEQQALWSRAQDPRTALFKVAQLAGFTQESFDACLNNEEVARGIIDIREKADKTFGVQSTPTFFINGTKISGAKPVEEFRKALDEALK